LDSIQYLDEVLIIDSKLKEYSNGFKLSIISDTLINRNTASLTDVLRYNSSIYFKENGYGMVSSPSFRGTNASQTAVIWNGIPINSNLTGQTDFNTIAPSSFKTITIRAGGGSTQYGSGAVGGSIHLNNDILFKEEKSNDLGLQYGSFSTLGGSFKTIQSNERSYFDLGVDFISSENDYKYLAENKKNENGEFQRFNANLNAGLKFKKKSTLSWNSNYFLGNRNFSGTLTAPSKDTYKDVTTRNLVTWRNKGKKLISIVKAAHLFERYRYFPDKNKNLFFEGSSNTLVGDYRLEYLFSNKLKVSSIFNYTAVTAEGTSIGKNTRNTLATVLLMNHKVSNKFSYGINLRQEFLNDFKNPFLLEMDAKCLVNNWYTIKVNASKNYRVPTFNDLYWNIGGNEELQPETSYQAEIGNDFFWKDFRIGVNGFYIRSEDLIKWQPGNDGLFSPVNISEAENYGVEFSVEFSQVFNEHAFKFSADYAYTSASDKEKNKQLLYVPFHKVIGLVNYDYKKFSVYYQLLYNGEVFTTTDNIGTVEAYSVSNIGLEYSFLDQEIPIGTGIKFNNIFDTYYESVAFRPMPNRNFQLFLNIKF